MPKEYLDRIREKYPEYDDIPDAPLARMILNKYPEYEDVLGDVALPTPAQIHAAPSQVPTMGQTLLKSLRETGEILDYPGRKVSEFLGTGRAGRVAGEALLTPSEPSYPLVGPGGEIVEGEPLDVEQERRGAGAVGEYVGRSVSDPTLYVAPAVRLARWLGRLVRGVGEAASRGVSTGITAAGRELAGGGAPSAGSFRPAVPRYNPEEAARRALEAAEPSPRVFKAPDVVERPVGGHSIPETVEPSPRHLPPASGKPFVPERPRIETDPGFLPPREPSPRMPTGPGIGGPASAVEHAPRFGPAVPRHKGAVKAESVPGLETTPPSAADPRFLPPSTAPKPKAAPSGPTNDQILKQVADMYARIAQKGAKKGRGKGKGKGPAAGMVVGAGVTGTAFAPEAEAGVEPAATTGEPAEIQQAGILGDLGRLLRRVMSFGDEATEAASGAARVAETVTQATRPAEEVLALGVHRDIVKMAEDAFVKQGIPRDPNMLLSDQIFEMVKQGKVQVTPEIGLFMRESTRNAARRMYELSELAKKLRAVAASNPEAKRTLEVIRTIGDNTASEMNWWQRFDNVRRSLLVTQLATTARNAITQAQRVGVDVIEQAMNKQLQQMLGKPVDPIKPFETVMNLFHPRVTKGKVDEILAAFPDEQKRLFATYASDIAASKGPVGSKVAEGLNKAQEVANVLNIANRTQEWFFRRAVFAARLDARLRAKGLSLDDVVRTKAAAAIDPDDIRFAVGEALEMTFAKSPEFGTMAYDLVRAVTRTPLSLIVPFPRFMANSWRFIFQHSPMGILSLLKPAERAAVAAGDMKTISRAVIGSGMLLGAYAFRSSPAAGPKWYEARLPDGRTVDIRPFNPFAAYFFLAEAARKGLQNMTVGDIAQGLLSTNIRAGLGLAVADDAIATLSGLVSGATEADYGKKIGEYAGEYLAGWLTPLAVINDVTDQFQLWMGKKVPYRESRGDFGSAVKQRVPGLRETLPPKPSPTRGVPEERQSPLLRQLFGATVKGKRTPLEEELARLEFEPREILPPSGEKEWDNLVAKWMGREAKIRLGAFIRTPAYLSAPDEVKADMMRRELINLREAATERVRLLKPRLYEKVYEKHLPKREREAVRRTSPLRRATPSETERYRERLR